MAYEEAVEEALCFGWIDSLTRPLDETRFKQTFTPRKPASAWSKSNKDRVARLIEQGLMTPTGLAAIEVARQNGRWSAYDSAEALEMPEDFQAALEANPTAQSHWNGFSPSVRRGILYWIGSAKREETRARRIARTIELASRGIRAMYDQ